MEKEGFWLLRTGEHMIWTNGVFRIVTSVSPSCRFVLHKVRRDIRRERRRMASR